MIDVLFLLGAAALTLIGAAHLTFHGIRKSSTEEKGES